jgi:hypothetical protein
MGSGRSRCVGAFILKEQSSIVILACTEIFLREIRMVRERYWLLSAIAGLALSAIGSFLPGGQTRWIPGVYTALGTLSGFELFWGILALLGCVVGGASPFLYKMGHKMLWSAVMLSGGLLTLICSLTWILVPGTLAPGGGLIWTVLYGAYICLIGSILTSVTLINVTLFTIRPIVRPRQS